MADWRQLVLQKLGARATPSTLAFLQGWQAKEGGHTNNTARFNYLNRMDTSFPSAGTSMKAIAAYPDMQTGVARTAELLRSGYPAIYNSLRSGQVDYQNPGVQGDLNRWLSGSRTPGMTPYVQSVARLAGQNVGAAARVGGQSAAPAMTPAAQPSIGNVMPLIGAIAARRKQRAAGERPALAPLLGAIMGLRQAGEPPSQPQVAAPGPGSPPLPAGGNMVVTSQGWKPTAHAGGVTSGLGWNDKGVPGDIMARAGQPVGAPVDGIITRRGSAQGGSSLYLMGDDGNEYWLGHIEDALPEGTRVRANQKIAVISNRHANPHLHITKRRVR